MTKGPWMWVPDDGYPETRLRSSDGDVLSIYESHGGGNLPSDDDARLIATLPDLLEALEGIIEIGKRDLTNPKYDGYFRTAQRALDKAKGCDCAAIGNFDKPKQHGADPHAKNCRVYTS